MKPPTDRPGRSRRSGTAWRTKMLNMSQEIHPTINIFEIAIPLSYSGI